MVNKIEIGDEVTSPSWGGEIATVKEIVPGEQDVAIFTNGGFWRVAQLQKVTGQRKKG